MQVFLYVEWAQHSPYKRRGFVDMICLAILADISKGLLPAADELGSISIPLATQSVFI
jgi:hypothetical protein